MLVMMLETLGDCLLGECQMCKDLRLRRTTSDEKTFHQNLNYFTKVLENCQEENVEQFFQAFYINHRRKVSF